MSFPALEFDLNAIAIIGAAVVSLLGTWLLRSYYEGRVRLVGYLLHSATVTVARTSDREGVKLNIHTIVIRNRGRKTANNIRIGHSVPRSRIEDVFVWPPVSYWIEDTGDETFELILSTLVPNEQSQVTYVYFPPLTVDQIHAHLKSDEALGQTIDVQVNPVLKPATYYTIWIFLLLGIGLALYWAILLIVFLLGLG